MKTFFLLCCTVVFALGPNDGLAQNANIVINSNQTLNIKQVFKLINKQTNYRFVYRNNLINNSSQVKVEKGTIKTSELLDHILADINVEYIFTSDDTIVIKRRAFSDTRPTETFKKTVQSIVGGVITDGDGMVLPGASIVEKGTSNGATSDFDGKFSLNVMSKQSVLVISYVGFVTQEIAVGDTQVFNIVMVEDTAKLDEIVITALGITRSERSLGYATQDVSGEDLTLTNEQNVLGSLAGKVAGVQVSGSSGASMGGTQKIKIRGVNSISGSGEPLLVVDGSPISNENFAGSSGADYGNLGQDINSADIESVSVLKGPAASALYGIRGQYGVIMITTKSGKKGSQKIAVELTSQFSFDRAGNFFPLQNLYGQGSSQTWMTLANGEKYVNLSSDESWGPKLDGTTVRQFNSFYPQDSQYGQTTPFVSQPSNIKDYYETGYTLSNGVSVSGGSENSTFRLSINDTRIEGVEPDTWLNRQNLGIKGSYNLSEKLSVSTNVNYATNNAERPVQGYGSKSMVQWLPRNVDMNLLENYKYNDGTFLNWNLRNPNSTTGEITDFGGLYWINPYVESNENIDNDRRDRFFGDIGLTYKILPELKISGSIRSDMYTQNIENTSVFRYGSTLPSYAIGKYQNKEMNYEFLAQYNKDFGDLSINANFGGNIFARRYSYVFQQTQGGLSSPGFYNIAASVDRPITNSYLLRKQIRSGFGMVSLGYKNTYFIDASIRNDNSSALPKNDNSYWYPSVSGSIVFSELLENNFLSFGKLRMSYAQAGSDLEAYRISPVYNVGTVYAGQNGTVNTLGVPNNLINPNIRPSFSHSYEAGIDLKFFKNRLGLDFTFYQQTNKDQILNLDVSGMSGYGSVTINAGAIENKGYEIVLSSTPFKTDNFIWNSTLNLSRNKSKVIELYPGADVYSHSSTAFSSVPTYLNSYVGKEFGSLVGQAYQRDSSTGKILLDNNNLPLYTDASHDFGTVLPDFTGGFMNTIHFGNFNLGVMIDYQIGGQFFSRTKMILVRTGVDPITTAINDRGQNVRSAVEEGGGVRVDGISAQTREEVTAYVDARKYFNGVIGRHVYEEWLYDASYVKLREISLGYVFDNASLENWPVERVSLNLIARNPLMIWQKAPKGLDPSEISAGGDSISWFESGQTNTVRSYGLNLKITF